MCSKQYRYTSEGRGAAVPATGVHMPSVVISAKRITSGSVLVIICQENVEASRMRHLLLCCVPCYVQLNLVTMQSSV